MTKPVFILASGSPRRRELLGEMGIAFTIIKPDIDESIQPHEAPLDYVRRLSIEKAQTVAQQVDGGAVVLAADTVVILAADTIGVAENGELLGKPIDADDARAMLTRLRGREHLVCTALTLLKTGDQSQQITRLTQTQVFMRDYTDDEIDAYIATGDPFDKAGSYAIQHEGFHPVERLDGSYNNVVGLPTETLRQMLAEIGWRE
jgi:septum formation protein